MAGNAISTITTMQDIAKLAGVSRTAVSAVINNMKTIHIKPETRQKIEKVLRETNFKPNPLGKSLATGKSFMIGMTTGEIATSFVPQRIEGIEDFLEERGYGLLLRTSRYEEEREIRDLEYMLERRVDGLIIDSQILMTARIREELMHRKIPTVYLSHRPSSPLPGTSFVCVNGSQSGYLGIRHLRERGYRHIACAGMTDWIKEGIFQAEKEFPKTKALEFWPWEKGENISEHTFDRWWKASPRPEALFINGDEFALRVMTLSLRRGIRIPEDLAILGLDDIPMAAEALIPLSTIAQPKYEQGRGACQLLFDMMNGKPANEIIYQPQLIHREST
jgi:LacI family transcriptional regulator